MLPLLTSGSSPTHLVVLTTQLLTDTHRRVLHAVLVSGRLADESNTCTCKAGSDVETYVEKPTPRLPLCA